MIDADEHIRVDASPEGMKKLRPVFSKEGTVTAGNSSGITDGAAAAVLMSEEEVHRRNLKPLGRIVDYAVAGVDPEVMGIGPVPAIEKLLSTTGMSIEDFDLIELNEAFAAQVLACLREVPMNPDRLNVNGGAIALGHPIGCTGTRITTTLLHELRNRNGRYGMVTLCISGGMGYRAGRGSGAVTVRRQKGEGVDRRSHFPGTLMCQVDQSGQGPSAAGVVVQCLEQIVGQPIIRFGHRDQIIFLTASNQPQRGRKNLLSCSACQRERYALENQQNSHSKLS